MNTNSIALPNAEETNLFSTASKYICTACNKHFQWKSGLSRHLRLFHLQNKKYKCDICDQTFYKQIGLSIHLKQHSKSKIKPLTHQNFSDILVNKAQKISQQYANIISETVYSSDSDCEYEILQTATKLKNHDNKSDHKCQFCEKRFVKLTSLHQHLKRHKNDALAESNDDGMEMDNSDSEPHEDVQLHRCNKCTKTFKLACNLANHLKIHLKQSVVARKKLLKTRYPCSLCNKVYFKKIHLDNHISAHIGNDEQEIEKQPCPECGKLFGRRALEIHKKTHTLSKPYLCMVCGKGYSRSGYLSIHMRTHSNYRPHLCCVCGKSFTVKRYLIVHSRIHNQERPFKCQHCNKGFIQKGNLVEHLRIHSGVKPHNCAICGKRFTHYSGLTQHLLTHNPIKRHICKICGKAFRLAGHYREHMRIHSGDRPYVCNICGRGFANSSSLVVHLRTHSGERPFKCLVCKKGFIKSYGLKQHKKTHAACNVTENIT